MKNIVLLVFLMMLTVQAKKDLDPDLYRIAVGARSAEYYEAINIVEKIITEPSSEEEKAFLEKALEQLKNGKKNSETNHKFFCAAINRDIDMLKLFLKEGADVNAKDAGGMTALNCSCANEGSLEIAKYLVEIHANVNDQDYRGWTALIFASCNGHVDIVKLLLENGADKTIEDKQGKTALWWAENQNQTEVIKILSEDINKPSKSKDDTVIKKQASKIKVEDMMLDVFTMSETEMAGCLFTGNKIIIPKIGCIYHYDGNGLTVVKSTSEGYLVTGYGGSSIIVVKASKDFLNDRYSFVTGVTYLCGGLFKYIGKKEFEFVQDLGETRQIYCFEAISDSRIAPR